MPGAVEDNWDAGTGNELPRFLSSIEEPAVAAAPYRALSFVLAAPSALVVRSSVTATIGMSALLASAYLAPEGILRRTLVKPVIEVATVRVVANPMTAGGDLEQRLTFASRLADHMVQMKEMPAVAAVWGAAQAPLQDADPQELIVDRTAAADPPSLLIVRNLPTAVSFADGVPSGIGEWAIGGQDPSELAGALKDRPEADVTADVELISGAGVSVGTRSILLPKAPETPPPAAIFESLQTGSVKAQEAQLEAEKPVRPKRRHLRAPLPEAEEVAQQDEIKSKPKRRKRHADDALRTPSSEPAGAAEDKKAEPASEPEAADKGAAQGPIAKFLAWLKSGSSAASKPTRTDDENDGTLRGLGMSPRD